MVCCMTSILACRGLLGSPGCAANACLSTQAGMELLISPAECAPKAYLSTNDGTDREPPRACSASLVNLAGSRDAEEKLFLAGRCS